MEVEGRLLGLQQLPASQSLRSGPVDRPTKVRVAVEEFSNSSPVNRPAFKQTGTHPRYVWEAVLSLTAALTIAFVLHKCFLTLSQAADTHKLRGSISKGEGSVRHLSEDDAGPCQLRAGKTSGHKVTLEDAGRESKAVAAANTSPLLGAANHSLGDGAVSKRGLAVSDNSARRRTSQHDASEKNRFISFALRLICCTNCCCADVCGKTPSSNVYGVIPEVWGVVRRRSSVEDRNEAWAGVYGEGRAIIESFAASEEDEEEESLEADGGAVTEVSLRGGDEGLETDGGFAESGEESDSPGTRDLLVASAEEFGDVRRAPKDNEEGTVVAARSGVFAEDPHEAVETDGGAEGEKKENGSIANSVMDADGAGGEEGKVEHSSMNPGFSASLRRAKLDKFNTARLVRARLLALASSGSMSPASPEKAQRVEGAGRGDGTPPDHKFIKKVFTKMGPPDENATLTNGLPINQPANSSTEGSEPVKATHETTPTQAEPAKGPVSSAGHNSLSGGSKDMTPLRSPLLQLPGSFARRKRATVKIKIPMRGPPGKDEPLSSMIARGVPLALIDEEKKRRRRELVHQREAEANRLREEFARAWLRGFSMFALWLAHSEDDVFKD
ncbi:hypothetical protein Emag_002382 [Eimeria magna]